MENKKMVFFHEGDLVELKHTLPNKPVMMVKGIVKSRFKDKNSDKSNNLFLGVKCCWFTSQGLYQEQIFSTKDLEKVRK